MRTEAGTAGESAQPARLVCGNETVRNHHPTPNHQLWRRHRVWWFRGRVCLERIAQPMQNHRQPSASLRGPPAPRRDSRTNAHPPPTHRSSVSCQRILPVEASRRFIEFLCMGAGGAPVSRRQACTGRPPRLGARGSRRAEPPCLLLLVLAFLLVPASGFSPLHTPSPERTGGTPSGCVWHGHRHQQPPSLLRSRGLVL